MFIILHYVSVCVCVWVSTSVCQCPRRPVVLNSLQLKLQVPLGCQMWALGTELRCSGRAVCALNAEPKPPAPLPHPPEKMKTLLFTEERYHLSLGILS